MATLITPTDVQKLQYNVTTAEGPGTVTVVTGRMQLSFETMCQPGPSSSSNRSVSFKALVDPALAPGHFRKATAIAAIAGTQLISFGGSIGAQCLIDDVQATLDDESGQVQIIVDA